MVVTLQPYFNTSHSPFIEKLHKKRIKNIIFIKQRTENSKKSEISEINK